jgi:hypothetical protein
MGSIGVFGCALLGFIGVLVIAIMGSIGVFNHLFSWALLVLPVMLSLFLFCSCGKIMDHDGEIIEVPLGVEFYAFVYSLPLTSTSHVDNSISTNHSKLWALLANNQDFWKHKSQIATTWAFYALLNFSSPKVSSNSNSTSQAKHLKCVVCYPFIPNAG